MKDESSVLPQKCSYCGGAHLEIDEKAVKCLDCGMGNYKKGWHKGSR